MWVNIGLGNCLLTNGTKSLTEPIVDFSSKVFCHFCGIHLRAISQEVLINLIDNKCLDIVLIKLLSHAPGANELMHQCKNTAATWDSIKFCKTIKNGYYEVLCQASKHLKIMSATWAANKPKCYFSYPLYTQPKIHALWIISRWYIEKMTEISGRYAVKDTAHLLEISALSSMHCTLLTKYVHEALHITLGVENISREAEQLIWHITVYFFRWLSKMQE